MTLKVSHYQNLSEIYRRNSPKPEWAMASIRRLLSPWEQDRLKFAFNDPKEFNTDGSVNPATFVKLLDQLEGRGNLSDSNLVKLVEAFTSKCSKADWKNFYQPVLKRVTDHGLTISIANTNLPEEYKVRIFQTQEQFMALPSSAGFFYPWSEDFELRFVIVWKDYIESVADDFEHWDNFSATTHFTKFCGRDDITYPLIFEGFSDGQYMILTDMFELNQIGTWPGAMRRSLLEGAYKYLSDQDECRYLELGEGYPGDQDTNLSDVRDHFVSLGFDDLQAVLFKPAETTYTSPALLVPIHGVDGVEVVTVTT